MIVIDENELRKECKDASIFDAPAIIKKLEEELGASKQYGVGLAANQIGINAKVCIIRTGATSLDLVNPTIIEQYDCRLFIGEGCLSFPNQWLTTTRFNEIFVKDALHPAGLICTGIEAIIVQHEVDHLYGKIMHDYIVKVPNGRNDMCFCGSGKKYKKCCLGKEIKAK